MVPRIERALASAVAVVPRLVPLDLTFRLLLIHKADLTTAVLIYTLRIPPHLCYFPCRIRTTAPMRRASARKDVTMALSAASPNAAPGGSPNHIDALIWQQQTLKAAELDLVWFEAGDGPPIVILHGGPGHDHRLMRALAAPLTRHFRCILPDQRGSGQSVLPHLDAHSLHIDRFVEDIEALRIHLNLPRLTLVGWSWGAALAFMYGLAHPSHVERLAMIAPGPIPFELLAVYQANLLRPLTTAERAEVAALQAQSLAAFGAGDRDRYQALFRRRLEIMFRVWFYNPALAEQHRESFAQAVDAYRIAQLEPYIYGSLGEFGGWNNLDQVKMPALIVYGYQDFEPITQAYTLREWMPQAQLGWLNECGHWPWLEQPAGFYPLLEAFLRDDVADRNRERA